MPGSILPLPVMLDEEDRKIYEKLEVPKSMVVRYGYMRMVGEFPYDGDAKPGCGSKLVIRTARGIELGEMLTTTCPNSGCGKSVSRKEMLDYIDNSGGKNFPFTTQGRILRVATADDVLEQQRLDARKTEIIKNTRTVVRELDLKMKLVDVELLLGGERMIFHYTSEDWVDFRELVRRLAADHQTRIEMHQVNARDEARIVADYEKCGQHCCCKQFLKVLKPVSMKSAKIQKATLDPTKISGRCGRLMCCLRYEDETYDDLRKRLPKRQTRWMTPDGPGTVLDTQILTQLALIQLDHDMSTAAYPIENLVAISKEEDQKYQAERQARIERTEARQQRRDDRRPPREGGAPGDRPRDQRPPREGQRGDAAQERNERGGERQDRRGPRGEEPRRPRPGEPLRDEEVESAEGMAGGVTEGDDRPVNGMDRTDRVTASGADDGSGGNDAVRIAGDEPSDSESDRDLAGDEGAEDGGSAESAAGEGQGGGEGGEGGKRRRRRRRRRRRGGGGPGEGGAGGGSPGAPGAPGGEGGSGGGGPVQG